MFEKKYAKSKKKVYCLLGLNKQLSFLWYFKKNLPVGFSKYFRESTMKISETSKSTILKTSKKSAKEKVV